MRIDICGYINIRVSHQVLSNVDGDAGGLEIGAKRVAEAVWS